MTHPDLQRATGPAAPTLDVVTRIGFAAKGIVTILVGVLALRFALRSGGEITGQGGAGELLLREPFGRLMLALLAVGLAAYAVWMFVAAFVDPERKGKSFQGIAERLGFFVTGIGYTLLAWTTINLRLGQRRGGGGLDLQHVLATVLTPHVGRVLVGLAGLIVMTAGVLQLRLGITGRFRKRLQTGRSRLARLVTSISGRVGYVTLGVLSLMAGWSLVEVAIEYDPSEASGWSEALWLLSGIGQGRWLLVAAALGLICYGLYFILQVRYRRL
jgi:Domain of Unknown Function (DUF1206)